MAWIETHDGAELNRALRMGNKVEVCNRATGEWCPTAVYEAWERGGRDDDLLFRTDSPLTGLYRYESYEPTINTSGRALARRR